MPKFSARSLGHLKQCHPLLQTLMLRAVSGYDFSVICGFRGEKEQNEAYSSGNSKLKWPQSKHNKTPSEAVDVVPYPIDWNNERRFRELGAHIKSVWESLPSETRGEWELSWGGDWKTFKDMPHFELRKK